MQIAGQAPVAMLRRMHVKIVLASIFLCVAWFSLAGCQIYDIVIDVNQNNTEIEFTFHYKGKTSGPVDLTTLRVREPISGRVVWGIETMDPSLGYEKKESTLTMKKLDDSYQLSVESVSRIEFGKVPEGFTQYFPEKGQNPILESAKLYEIFVFGGAHRGRMEFQIH